MRVRHVTLIRRACVPTAVEASQPGFQHSPRSDRAESEFGEFRARASRVRALPVQLGSTRIVARHFCALEALLLPNFPSTHKRH